VLDDLDLILVMTVNPGFGGQQFLPATLPKIQRVKQMIAGTAHPIHLEVDGGIDHETTTDAVAAGANVLVAGTSIFGHPEGVAKGIQSLRSAAPGDIR
jgi:ribulose-phosphate 3-epimerase